MAAEICLICRDELSQEGKMHCNGDEVFGCAESLCQLLFGSVPLSLHQYFQRETYCAVCWQTIQDVNVILERLKRLENRANRLLVQVEQDLKANYNNIGEKTSQEVLQERVTAVLDTTDDNKERLDKYSYDEIVEILHEAAIKRPRYFWNTSNSPVNEMTDVDGIAFERKIKVEKEEDVDSFDSDDDPLVETELGNETESLYGLVNSFQYCSSNNNGHESSETDSRYYESENKRNKLSSHDHAKCSECNKIIENSQWSSEVTDKLSKSTVDKRKLKRKGEWNQRVKRKSKQPRVECTICNQKITARSIADHLRTHTGEKPFSCKECEQKFTSKLGLVSHLERCHGMVDPDGKKIKIATVAASVQNEFVTRKRFYHCNLCSWTYNMKSRYLRHLKNDHLNKDVKNGDTFRFHFCDAEDCLSSYMDLDSFRKHIFEVHLANDESISIPECEKCQKPFVHQSNLELHSKCHEDDSFGCKYCNLEISSPEELERHLPRHEISFSESLFSHLCEECGEGFIYSKMLRKHVAKTHVYSSLSGRRKKLKKSPRVFCKICQKVIYCKTLAPHMLKCHTSEGSKPDKETSGNSVEVHGRRSRKPPVRLGEVVHSENITTPRNEKDSVMCTICNQLFTKKRLKVHVFSHTHPEGFPCPKCNLKKSSPGMLEYHLNRSHPLDKSDPGQSLPKMFQKNVTKCDICNKNLKIRAYYRKHIVRHHPEEYQSTHPHVCQFCWFVFEREEERNSHVETNHNANLCSFPDCGKRFSNTARLNAHLNIHNNAKPFLCPYCKKGFNNNSNCYSHVNKVHTKHRSLRCKLCAENPGYYVKKEFIKHVQRTHPEISVDQYKSILSHQKPTQGLKIEKVST